MTDPGSANEEKWTTEKWKHIAEKIEIESQIKEVPVREVASLSISLRRTLQLLWVRRTQGWAAGREYLRFAFNTYKEMDAEGNGIPIAAGAVERAFGGPLNKKDYKQIASTVMDPEKVGSKFAAAAREYADCLKSRPDMRQPSLLALNAMLEYPPGEIAILALQFAAIGAVRQPFETL
ncbi:MAG: hypothetical protein ACR2JB_03895 [Bryobacteraceae bacterium]